MSALGVTPIGRERALEVLEYIAVAESDGRRPLILDLVRMSEHRMTATEVRSARARHHWLAIKLRMLEAEKALLESVLAYKDAMEEQVITPPGFERFKRPRKAARKDGKGQRSKAPASGSLPRFTT